MCAIFSISSFFMGKVELPHSLDSLDIRRCFMAHFSRSLTITMAATLVLFAMTSCSGGGGVSSTANLSNRTLAAALPGVDSDTSNDDSERDNPRSILKRLDTITTIGSTVDPINGDQNPYGLDIAKVTSGKFERGDLAVCNFNDAANVQGTGTTIIALHARPGSMPTRVARSAALNGCDEIALAPDDTIWASAFSANDNPLVSPAGALLTTLSGGPWHHPFGQVFAPHAGPFGSAAFYESNAADGSIVRIDIPSFNFDVIATGFAVNHGVPGSILGPSGLQYDAKHDRLYIVDGANNTIVSFKHVSTIPSGGISVNGTTFGGPFAHRARLVFSGPPLNGPISAALLPDGHLVVGNTLDPAGQNLMVEITPHGRLLDVKNVDTGAGAALFGMIASGRDVDDVKLYFNDDNDNTVKVLTP